MPAPRLRACVTGATGYLASELVAQLLERGYHVHATVRSLTNTARNACLTGLPKASLGETLTLHEADLQDERAFDECVKDVDYVFHTASPFVTENITDPHKQLIAPSLEGTRNVFSSIQRSVARGVAPKPRVVLTSSVAAVMGKAADKEGCFDETDWNYTSTAEGSPPGDGIDMYRYSKLVAEKEAWALAAKQGLELSTIMPSFIVGPPRTPRTDGESLRNMKQALEGAMPHRGDTPMADVRDCAAAHIAAAETPTAANTRFLVSTGKAVSRARVLEILREKYPDYDIADGGAVPDPAGLRHLLCGKNLEPVLGLKLRDPEHSLLDMADAMLKLGVVQPKVR